MNLFQKVLAIFSYLNLVSIFLLIFFSILNHNNHYGIAFDQIFLSSSLILFSLSTLILFKKLITTNLIAIILSLTLNHFNIAIDYQRWLEREQPNIFDIDINTTCIKLKSFKILHSMGMPL